MQTSARKSFLLVAATLSFISVWTISCILHDGLHSLNQLGGWSSYKLMGFNGLMGTQDFVSLRQTLAGHHLNLGEWQGHNQVIWNNTTPWSQLRFRFKSAHEAYLWVFFSQSGERRYGLRLSRHSKFPSGLFTLDREGQFLEKEIINLNIPEDWNQVLINAENNHFRFYLNGNLIFEKAIESNHQRFVSFRSGLLQTSVDDVEIETEQGKVAENFSPAFQLNYLIFSLALYLILLAIIAAGLFFFRVANIEKSFALISWQIVILIAVLGYHFFDFYIWTPRYAYTRLIPFNRVNESEAKVQFESAREKLFAQIAKLSRVQLDTSISPIPIPIWQFIEGENPRLQTWNFSSRLYQLVNSAGQVTYVDPDNLKTQSSKALKIVYMGTSQTWGAGAKTPEKTFVSLSAKLYSEKLGRPVAIFNQAVCGSYSTEQLSIYETVLKNWNPDVLIVNLSNNDWKLDVFEKNLQQIIQLNQIRKVKTIFMLEANDIEGKGVMIKYKHDVMKRVAEKYKIPTVDLYGFMISDQIYDSGILWCDIVHMNQYAHNIAAKWIVQESLTRVPFSFSSTRRIKF